MTGPPETPELLKAISADKPLAVILAGHNGSGKSTLWKQRLAEALKIPLINADRLTLSLLPEPEGDPPQLAPWAAAFRDNDERWQRLSQASIQCLVDKVVAQGVPFAYETVFSHLVKLPDGKIESKGGLILRFQEAGYSVALLFVGLASPELSVLRVKTRRDLGGHAVPEAKLRSRFPRTQEAIRGAAPLADLTLMFDNSRGFEEAFTLVRAQSKADVRYDCRHDSSARQELIQIANSWLKHVAPVD
jgi:predicted ABC-type ATPase